MPPKRARARGGEEADGGVVSKKPKAVARKKGAWKMPPPLPVGEVLNDFCKKQWVIGASVGKGGFGEIYLAAPQGSSTSGALARHVIKIEPHENGPLFTELSFYRRVAKVELIERWVKDHRMRYLAIPKYISSGIHSSRETRYRFMVMERFGEDVEKKFCMAQRQFGMKTVCHLALRLLEAVEYLHEQEYVHADIKGSNLLTGHGADSQHEVYLVDYGLAYRFNPEGRHKEYKEDPRREHDGTIEFTSIDAHKGVSPSRRGDLEILGYCLLQWACGKLPWEDKLENKPYVAAQKIKYKSDPDGLIQACFSRDTPAPSCLEKYMKAVYKLEYKDRPNYDQFKSLFQKELSRRGWKDDGRDLDWLASRKRKPTDEADTYASPLKKQRQSPRRKAGRVVKPSAESRGQSKQKHVGTAGEAGPSIAESKPTDEAVSYASPLKKQQQSPRRKASRVVKPSAESRGRSKQKHVGTAGEAGPSTVHLPVVSYPAELGYGEDVDRTVRLLSKHPPRDGSDDSDEEKGTCHRKTKYSPKVSRRRQAGGKKSPGSRAQRKKPGRGRNKSEPIEISDSSP